MGRQEVMFHFLALGLIMKAVQPFCKITLSYVFPSFARSWGNRSYGQHPACNRGRPCNRYI